jgi:hypothetical protein
MDTSFFRFPGRVHLIVGVYPMTSGVNRDTPAITFEAFSQFTARERAALSALSPDEAHAAGVS